MPPRKVAAERNNEAEEAVQQDDPDATKEFLQWMKQQMTDLAAKNDATNAKLEMLSIQYQNLQDGRTQEAAQPTPQGSEAEREALRSTSLPRDNHTAATQSISDLKHAKFPKISYPVFDETGDPDWHIRRFKVIARTNGVTNTEDLQNLFGTTLQGNHINWYIDFETENTQASWEDMERSFLQKFRKLKTSSEILRALGSITQERNEPVDVFYDRFKQLADKLSQRPEEDYLCEWFKKGLLPWIQQGIVIRGVKTLSDILNAANDISRELSVLNKTQAPLLPLPPYRPDNRSAPALCNTCGKVHSGRCWFAPGNNRSEDPRRPKPATAAMYTEEVNVDAFQPSRSDACWECGSLNHRRSQCPILRQRWAQARPEPASYPNQTMDNSRNIPAPRRGGVTLKEVHGTETNVSTISAAVVSTRSKATLPDHIVEARKPFPDQHWERLHNIRKDLQKGLETPSFNSTLQQVLNHTNVTITLSKLLQISPELHQYIQQATLQESTENPATIEVNATTIDPDAAVIHLQLGNHELTNVLVDGGSGVNVMSNHLRQKLGLPVPKLAQFILRMANDAPVTPLGILSHVAITTHGVSTPATFVIIDMPNSSNFPIILGRPWLRDMDAIHDWSRNQIRIHRQGKTVIIPVDSCITRARAHQIRQSAGTHWGEGLSQKQEAMVFQANPELIPLAEIHLASLVTDQEKLDIPSHFSKEVIETVAVDATPAVQALQKEVVNGWSHGAKDKVELINLGTIEEPKFVKINAEAPEHIKQAAISLFHEYHDIFAWGHEDLKGIPSSLAEHTIDLVPNATPVQQRRYRMNPNYAARVKTELDKLLAAKFISPVDSAPWLSPMVIIPKKNGTSRICVDFRKLNAATKKDHYPLPYMEEIIDEVAGHEMYSFLDCFSGYYQVAMAEQDKNKTAFSTEWGPYQFERMPFGAKNAPMTFQRVMELIFRPYLKRFFRIYLDDGTVYGPMQEYITHLRQIFQACRANGVSLNADKYMFLFFAGVILGYIVCKHGKLPDPEKIKDILNMTPPTDQKGIQRLLGLSQFNRIYIEKLAHITAPITALNHAKYTYPQDWTPEAQAALEKIKTAYSNAPILIAPDWSKPFHVHTDASNIAVGVMLAQNINGKHDQPGAYASRLLNQAERNYSTTEREALAMIYAIKIF